MYREDYNEEELKHYGMPRRSGRYPWGSGKESYQRTADFLSRIDEFKNQGMNDTEIARAFGLSTTQYRTQRSLANEERRLDLYDKAVSMRERGMSLNQIAKEMGFKNDSSVRSLLNEQTANRMSEAKNVAKLLKAQVDKKGMIDIGAGVELELGISKEKLKQAIHILEMEGYLEYGGRAAQVTNPGQQTTIKVLCKPGTEHKDIYDFSKIHSLSNYNTKTGEFDVDPIFAYPTSVDSKRVKIRYAEEGGVTKDGTIEIRRGVDDLSLGNSHYSQVRILVDKDRYLKGMAVYKDDDNFPPGVDIVFNTNKSSSKSLRDVLKPIHTEDPDNPFGSKIKEVGGQSYYVDKKTGERKLSAINKRADEGDWNGWSDGLPSQFLAKQSKALIKKQLNLSKADKLAEYEEIMSISNPTIRKHLLQSFSDDCDASAVHLKAASLPRQKYQVILPIDSLKDNECYAPNFKDGEKLALVRFPHGGTFEIPLVTVNNKNKDAMKMLGSNPKDAICINSNVAERLSGADFDGDTVLALPTGNGNKINSTEPLKGLKGFDNKKEYPARPGMKVMTKKNTQMEMGKISNLITDMTIKGANSEELARAVKHSMVVIDAAKHGLDYKKSEADNQIAALKKRYQTSITEDGKTKVGGASTLLSRAKGELRLDKEVGAPKINQKGKSWYDPTKPEGAIIQLRKKEVYIGKDGKEKVRTSKTTNMAETNDARKLSSGYIQEELYADYANYMKSLANTARKSIISAGNLKYSPEAKQKYKQEVETLTVKLNTALMNAPRERQAQLIANSIVKAKKQSEGEIDDDQLKKIKQHALSTARARVGAKRTPIEITDREWEAIQSGAITENVLTKIIRNADVDILRDKATPRNRKVLTPAKLNKLKAMSASGYTNAQIAEALGVSASAVAKAL